MAIGRDTRVERHLGAAEPDAGPLRRSGSEPERVPGDKRKRDGGDRGPPGPDLNGLGGGGEGGTFELRKRKGQVLCRLEAVAWILFQAVRHDLPHSRWDGVGQLRGVLSEDHGHQLYRRFAPERARARNQLVKDQPETEDIGAMIDRPPAHLLGRHIGDGAHHEAGLGGGRDRVAFDVCGGGGGMSGHLGHPEIENLHPPVAREHDVGGFEVAMRDACGVGSGQPISDLDRDVEDLAQPEFHVAQRFAVHEFGHDVGVAHIVDGHDVRMVQRSHGARFQVEALAARGIAGDLGR